MTYTESAVTFDCRGERLVGVLARPDEAGGIGVVIVVGGPQYRVGSHRQFVLVARALAAAGVPVLRFDYRGMGDSTGDARSFEDVDDDIDAAVSALRALCPGTARVVLWGLCDAASAALLYCARRSAARIAGLVLVNPWVRTEAGLARAHLKHYYRARVLEPAFWRRLVRGEVQVARAVRSVAVQLRQAIGGRKAHDAHAPLAYQDLMADALRAFQGPVLLVLCGRDLTAREFLDHAAASARWSGLLRRPNVERCDVAQADHTFSTTAWRSQVVDRTVRWLSALRTEPCLANDCA